MRDGAAPTYHWRCGECNALYEPTGPGMRALWDHCRAEHGMGAKEAGCDFVTSDGEVIHPTSGPSVLKMLIRQGYITTDSPDDKRTPPLPTVGAKKTGGIMSASRQTGRVVVTDVEIRSPVLLLFQEAIGLWPERYAPGTTDQLADFIEEMVTVAALAVEMRVAEDLASGLVKHLVAMEEEEEDGEGVST